MSAGTVTCTPVDGKGTWLIALQGEHDLATRPGLERETRDIWPRCKVAVIDLSDTTFIDSWAIRWLLSVESALEAAGAHILGIVEGPSGSVADRIFEILRVRACPPLLRDAGRGACPCARGTLFPDRTRMDRRDAPERAAREARCGLSTPTRQPLGTASGHEQPPPPR